MYFSVRIRYSGENLILQFDAEKGTLKQRVEPVLSGIPERLTLFRTSSGHSYRELDVNSVSEEKQSTEIQFQNQMQIKKATPTGPRKPKNTCWLWCCSSTADTVAPMKHGARAQVDDQDLDVIDRATTSVTGNGM